MLSIKRLDRICDYTPFVSTISNLGILFRKHVFKPAEATLKGQAFTHIEQKNTMRCLTLLVPILGNLVIVFYDIVMSFITTHDALRAIKIDPAAFLKLDEEKQKDQSFILSAVKVNPRVLKYINPDFMTLEIANEAVGIDGMVLRYVSRYSTRVVPSGLGQSGYVLVSQDEYREIVMIAVEQNGRALEHAGDLQEDKDVVIAAVRSYGPALHFAPELQNDPEVVKPAVEQNGMALQHAHKDLQDNDDIVGAARDQNYIALIYASERIQKEQFPMGQFRHLASAVSSKGWGISYGTMASIGWYAIQAFVL